MYQSTAEEYTWLQIASHTASYSILPSQVTKAFQKNPVSFQGAKYHDPTFTLVFNPSLVCSKFLRTFSAHLHKAPHCKHRGGFCTWQTDLDASPLSITGQHPHSSYHVSFNPYNQAPFAWPAFQQSLPSPQSLQLIPMNPNACYSFLLPPTTATLWSPQWQAGPGVAFGLCLPCSTSPGAALSLGWQPQLANPVMRKSQNNSKNGEFSLAPAGKGRCNKTL